MNIEILKKILIPTSKLPFIPVNSTKNHLAFSTHLSEGIFIHKLYTSTADDSDNDDEVDKSQEKPSQGNIKLNGVHSSGVQFVTFGQNNSPLLFATACSDEVNIWDFSLLDDNGRPEHYTIAQNLGSVQCMCFSTDDSNIAISISNEVWVIKTQSAELIAQFIGDGAFAICMEFCYTMKNLLVTLTDERTYRIYDVTGGELLYQSSIISSFSLISLSMHPSESYFAVGSSDGVLRVFDMTLHNSLHEINISHKINREIPGSETVDTPVINLKYWKRKATIAQSKFAEEIYLAVGCTNSFLIYNANSMELIRLFCFDYNLMDNGLSDDYKAFSSTSLIDFSSGLEQNELKVTAVSSSSNTIHVFRVHPDHYDVNLALELMSIDPLLDTSPLKAGLTPKTKPTVNSKAKMNNKRPIKKKVDKMNQPITFKKKISSSGYSADKPRRQMFAPQTNQSKTKRLSKDGSRSSGTNVPGGNVKKEMKNPVGPWGLKVDSRELKADYPKQSEAPIHLVNNVRMTEKSTPINDICFSDSGKTILCALSDTSLMVSKTKALKDATCYTGHSGTLNSCSMGHQNGYMMTASSDCTVKLWTPHQAEPIMSMTHYKHNFKQDDNDPIVNKKNPKFSKEIVKASFYFVDKFILLAQGKTLCLYSHHIDPVKNEVKRYQNNSRYKMVKDFEITETQNITTFSAINSFYSYHVICACSNRDLAMFDMNRGEQVHTIKDAHTRPVQSIYQIQGSSYVSLSAETYDLFVTSAQSDGVKLWDTRTMKCVRKYEGHLNRAQKVGLSVSPCARFIAVGSEDKSTYIYDIRSNSYLHCLPGHTDNVSAVCFHPQKPLLVSASCAGTVRTYSDVEIS